MPPGIPPITPPGTPSGRGAPPGCASAGAAESAAAPNITNIFRMVVYLLDSGYLRNLRNLRLTA
jgi:hypothetical protein